MSRSTQKPSDAEVHRCQWLDCEVSFNDAESLYEHITSLHIGRKSNGTLSLDCHWAGCSSKATKRDHLTSHARVHINLKPHSCEVCQKSFKRPQDLKKHEKIHTEEHHAHHKHSKAVVGNTSSAPSGGLSSSASTPPLPQQHDFTKGVPPTASFLGFPAYPGFPYFGQPATYSAQPQYSHLDVAQIIEHQRQLNAQVSAAYGIPSLPYGMQFPSAFTSQPGGNPSMPMFSQGLPAPHPFPYYHPGQNGGFPLPHHMGLQGGQSPMGMMNAEASGGGAAGGGGGNSPPQLYPSLQGLSSTSLQQQQQLQQHQIILHHQQQQQLQHQQLQLQQESIGRTQDDPSSPASHRSPYSAHSTASSSSPKVPSLSPASQSNSYSPSPEQDNDSLFIPSVSGNAVAGQKRTFEDAAGEFFGTIKNKRFQDDDYSNQLESIDALAALLNPSEFTSTPAGGPYARSSQPSHPSTDFDRTDVEHINDILANLAQNIDEFDRPLSDAASSIPPSAFFEHQPPQHLQQSPRTSSSSHLNSPYGGQNQTPAPSSTSSVYPSLGTYERPLAPLPYRQSISHSAYQDPSSTAGLASIRVAKTPSAPTIAPNDHRQPTYHHIERLTRAAPSSSYRIHHLMDVDDDEDVGKPVKKAYSASLRSTSLDVETRDSQSSSTSSPPPLTTSPPSTTSSLYRILGPTLPPISSLSSANPKVLTTLPPIRDMLRSARFESTATTSLPPVTPGGMMERLVPEFKHMGMDEDSPSDTDRVETTEEKEKAIIESIRQSALTASPITSDYVDEPEEIDAASDLGEEEEDAQEEPTKSKKIPTTSPEPMEMDQDPLGEDEVVQRSELKAKRLAVLARLALWINEKYRKQAVASKDNLGVGGVIGKTPTPFPSFSSTLSNVDLPDGEVRTTTVGAGGPSS